MPKNLCTIQEKVDRLFPLYFYMKHRDLACKDLLGLPNLAPHHSVVIRDWAKEKPVNHLVASRGMGKSITLATDYLLSAMLIPRLKLIVVAGTGSRGSKLVMIEISRIIECHLNGQNDVGFARYCLKDPKKIIHRDPARWEIRFTNGSTISSLPLGLSSSGDITRGQRANRLGIDESMLVPQKLFDASLGPMLNVNYDPTKTASEQVVKNTLCNVSTIDYSNRSFWKLYKHYISILEGEEIKDSLGSTRINSSSKVTLKKEDISCFEFNMDDSSYVSEDGKRYSQWGLDVEGLMKKKNLPTTDVVRWMAENKNIPLDIDGGYFNFESIELGQRYQLDHKKELTTEIIDSCSGACILGIDTAAMGTDNSAFVVIKAGVLDTDKDVEKCMVANLGKPCKFLSAEKGCKYRKKVPILFAYEENKMSQEDKVKLVHKLMGKFNIVAIALDGKGGGSELSDLLRTQSFIASVLDYGAPLLYDPNKMHVPNGSPLLTLYSATQQLNLEFAGFLRGVINSQTMLFPLPLSERPVDPRIFKTSGYVESLVSQLCRIKAISTGASIKFIIETIDPVTGKKVPARKDLFSALLYASGKLRELVDEKNQNEEVDFGLVQAVAFNM